MGKGPDTHTTTQVSEPPEYVRPYIEHALGSAQSLFQGRPLYAQSTMHPMMQEGAGMAVDVARNPAVLDPALNYAQSAIGGDFLGADALRDASRAELDDVIGGTRSAFERAGRGGSGMANYALGRGVTAALAPAYQRERQMQQQSALAAPMLEQARMAPAQSLFNLGGALRGQEEKYYQEPWDRLARYTGIALGTAPGQLAGGTITGSQPIYQPSPFSQIAGAGLTAAGLFL